MSRPRSTISRESNRPCSKVSQNSGRISKNSLQLSDPSISGRISVNGLLSIVLDEDEFSEAYLARAGTAAEALRSSRWRERLAAVRELGTLGKVSVKFAPDLAVLLEDPDWDVRMAAVQVLGALGEAATLGLALANKREEIREAALTALSGLGESAAPELSVALESEFVEVRVKAAAALGQLFCSVAERSSIACKVMAMDLSHADALVRSATLKALGYSGDMAHIYIDDIAALLGDSAPEVRCAAAEALGSLQPASGRHIEAACAEAAKVLTQSQSPAWRNAAAIAIGHLGEAASKWAQLACKTAAVYLHDDCVEQRVASAIALSEMPDVAVAYLQDFVALLDDDFPQVHCAATKALISLGPAARPYMLKATRVVACSLDNPEPLVRMNATEVLGELSHQCGECGETSQMYTEAACRVAKAQLSSSNWTECMVAAEALAAFGTFAVSHWKAMADLSMTALQSEDPFVRSAAARVLSRLGTAITSRVSDACRVAAVELKNPDWTVRASAAHALYTSGEAAGLREAELFEALQDTRAVVRDRAANALGSLGTAGVGHLALALKDIDWKQRVVAYKTFQKWPPESLLAGAPRSPSPYFFTG